MKINTIFTKENIINIFNNVSHGLKQIKNFYFNCELPLYSSNAAFFLLSTSIPISMLLFSTFSLIQHVPMDEVISYVHYLFPRLTYVDEIVESVIVVSRDLASKSAISLNIIIALFLGSTGFYSFIIGIRRVHGITRRNSFIGLRLLAIFNMIVFLFVIIIMLIVYVMGSTIIKYITTTFPFASDVINTVFGYRYLVTSIIIFVLAVSIYGTVTRFERKIRHNWYGGLFVAISWQIVSNLFSLYFLHFPPNAGVYGSFVGLMLILLWLYICMNIIFIGAAVNEVCFPEKRILRDLERDIQLALVNK